MRRGFLHPLRRKTINHIPSPDNSDPGIERLIQTKGKTAPRITPRDIHNVIISEYYFTAAQGVAGRNVCSEDDDELLQLSNVDPKTAPLFLLTFCVLVLRNGFTVTGESACASPENFDAEISRRVARANAEQKIWPLLGYLLKEELHREEQDLQTTWQERLLNEYSELVLKLDKLNTFLASEAGKQIQDPWLLHEQAKCMANYAGVLEVRIRNFNEEPA